MRRTKRDDLDPLAQFLDPFVSAKEVLPRTADELFYLISTGFVATDGERIVGFATLEIYSNKLGEVRSLTVSPDYRGKGIATKLVEACVNLAREKNVYEVMAITAADDLFRNLGFHDALPGQKRALFLQTRNEM